MKTLVCGFCVVAMGSAAVAADQPQAAPRGARPVVPRASAPSTPAVPVDPWPDTVTLARGTTVRCRIVEASLESIAIEYPRPGAPGAQPLRRKVSWSDLRSADFAMDADFHRLVAARDPAKDSPGVAARWAALAPLAGRPHHPAGELALTLARLSLNHPEASARQRALIVCQALATTDWSPARRDLARLYQARILTALGRTEEAGHEARLLTQDCAASPEAAMPAHLVLATADFEALKKLESDHPRWDDDVVVRPEREALFHQAIEAALKPSLFQGALEEPASRGLWAAVEVLEFARHLPAAADTARDLISLYPDSPLANDAASFLKRHRLPLDPDTTREDPSEPDPATPTTAPSDPPTRTATEPVVHRRPRYGDAALPVDPATTRPPAPSPPEP